MTETLCLCGCGEHPRPGKRLLRGHWSRMPEARAVYQARRRPIETANPSGICQCGCGQPAPVALNTRLKAGLRKGEPVRFINGHALRGKRGPEANAWKGGRWVHKTGYVMVYAPEHPAATMDGYVPEHRLVAEQTLGRLLRRDEHVHHINGVKHDNRPENLLPMQHECHAYLHGTKSLDSYRLTQGARAQYSAAGKKGAEARWGPKETRQPKGKPKA